MAENILVPLDGSALAESALPLDVTLARLTSSAITLLKAIPGLSSFTPPTGVSDPNSGSGTRQKYEEELSAAHEYLGNVGRQLEGDGLEVRVEVVEGAPATAIVEYAEENSDVWLIAMATRHCTPHGSWAFGSVAEEVLHRTSKPVLLIRPRMDELGLSAIKDDMSVDLAKEAGQQSNSEPGIQTIIVPLDGSWFAEEAVEHALRLSLATGARLALICAISPPPIRGMDQTDLMRISVDVARGNEKAHLARYLSDLAEELRAKGLEVLTDIIYGEPAETILGAAKRLHGDLIVVAAHGRRDLERLWLGSVAQKLVQSSTLPLLLMRSADAELRITDYDLRMNPV